MGMLLTIVGVLAGIIAPGYCLTRRLTRDTDLAERWILTVGIGLFAVPTVVFLVAWAFELEFSRRLVLGVALGVVCACRPWRLPSLSEEGPSRYQWLVPGALLAGSLLLLFATEIRFGDRLNVFHPCLQELAAFLGQHDGTGWTVFDPGTGRNATHIFNHASKPVLGLEPMIGTQRAVNGAILASVMMLAGRAALDLTTLFLLFLVAGGGYLLARPYIRRESVRVGVGLLTLAAVHGLFLFMLNETVFALAAGLLLLVLLSRDARGPGEYALAGFLLAIAVASRMFALAWVIPIGLILRDRPARAWGITATAFVLSVAPFLATRWILTGSPFSHHSQEGAEIEHTFLGLQFLFRPLNWPFLDSLVAQPGDVLPPALLVPLAALRSMGALLAAAFLAGFLWILRFHRSLALVVATWFLPIFALLSVQGYVDDEKISWLLLGVPVLPMTLSVFVSRLFGDGPKLGLIATWSICAAGLALAPGWLSSMQFASDTRSYFMVAPQIVPAPRSDAARRLELGKISLLPSLHEVRHRTTLLQSLIGDDDGAPFRSGHVVIWSVLSNWRDLTFPIHGTTEAPEYPDPFPAGTYDDLLYWEGVFTVHLRLPASPAVNIRMYEEDMGPFTFDIDPGPLPHRLRHIVFYVAHDEEFPRVIVRANGNPVPVRRLGYHVHRNGAETTFRDLRLVTNVDLPATQTMKRLPLGPQEWLVEPHSFSEDEPVEPGRLPSEWPCVTSDRPCELRRFDRLL